MCVRVSVRYYVRIFNSAATRGKCSSSLKWFYKQDAPCQGLIEIRYSLRMSQLFSFLLCFANCQVPTTQLPSLVACWLLFLFVIPVICTPIASYHHIFYRVMQNKQCSFIGLIRKKNAVYLVLLGIYCIGPEDDTTEMVLIFFNSNALIKPISEVFGRILYYLHVYKDNFFSRCEPNIQKKISLNQVRMRGNLRHL